MSTIYLKPVRDVMRKPAKVNPRTKFTQAELGVFERDGHKCHYCGNTDYLTLDHVVPRSKGGTNDPSNLVTACFSCNASKGSKSYSEFVEWRAAELAAYTAMHCMGDCL